MSVYYYLSPSEDGWQNLATDECMLNTLGEDDILLYFYINQNDVIIGKNQNAWKECNLAAMEADGVRLVRRCSGGGAVYHDQGNLNFSFLMHEKNYDLTRQLGVILKAVKALGIHAEFTGRNDLTADGKKFSGNAFCMRRQIRQHHGTLLIDADLSRLQNYLNVPPQKIKSKGIESVRARVTNLCELVPGITLDDALACIKRAYAEEYGSYQVLDLSAERTHAIRKLYEKQSSWEWRLGHSPQFDYEIDCRFDWGGVQLLLSLKNAYISQAQVYSDAMDFQIAETISATLLDARFTSEEMAARLTATGNAQLAQLAEHILSLKL